MAKIVIFAIFVLYGQIGCLELRNRAYENFVVKVAEDVPAQNCKQILENLQSSLTSASQYLFSALDSKAFLRSATVLLPSSWPDSCAPSAVMSGSGETSDVTVIPRGPTRGRLWTQQPLGCGQPGDQIYLAFQSLLQADNNLGRSLVKEFAMYRYGVFEEQGYFSDPIYPMCYYDDVKHQGKVTGCSDLPINDNGICNDANAIYNATQMVDKNARSSIIFAPEATSVSMFCDEGTHDKIAPTKQNLICQRRSILDVVLSHADFAAETNSSDLNVSQITDTTPNIVYKRQKLTRYVFVIENTKDMIQRESWKYMRLAINHWILGAVPSNTEVGLVLTEEGKSLKACKILSAAATNIHEFYSAIPFLPGDSMRAGCLHCGLKDAMEMLNQRTKLNGAARNVIVVISAGMNANQQTENVLKEIGKANIRIASVNYPNIVRSQSLNSLAEKTNGVAYTVFEHKLNVDSTLLTTYFELVNVLYDIVAKFYSGNQADLPIEIHRREIADDGRTSVTGSFMLDPNMGEPAKIVLYTHNVDAPLIKSFKLTSPSHQVYDTRNDRHMFFRMILLYANISEPGTWTYTVEPYPGNPQPHFLQVMATPKSATVPVLRSKFWTHRNQAGSPLILLTEVKLGEMPVLGAKVEVVVTKYCNPCNNTNGSTFIKYKLELLDTGSGDPDITKGDGVYSRYFSASEAGIGLYTFEVTVTDNGNTAYSWSETFKISDKPCCGSTVPPSGVQPISPFQRILPKRTIYITSEDILTASQTPAGKIGDLKVEVMREDMRARLSWTSPDMGGNTVTRYEVKYSKTVLDIIDNFETTAVTFDNGQPPFPLPPGSETTFTLDMAQHKELLDQPLYFAVKAYPKMTSDVPGTVSNWVRVLIPSPPPPPTLAPRYIEHEQSYWPNGNSVGVDPVNPTISKAMNIGLELILPIVIGILLLVVLFVLYCYFCVVKRRDRGLVKKSPKSSKNDKLNSTITIVPSTPQNNPSQQYSTDIPHPLVVGVPTSNYGYEDESKKRYSLVNQQEQQLIEELKQQQQMGHRENTYGGVSVISNSLNRNGAHTLSPYNTWSASQLLHEHERRHSPLDNMTADDQMSHDMMMNGSQIDHMSINGQNMDHMSLNGHHMHPQMTEHYQQGHIAPPVPPLPTFNGNGYPVNYNIYGTHQLQNHQIYQPIRAEAIGAFNPSLQGSMSSVNSGEKKRRNVTMV